MVRGDVLCFARGLSKGRLTLGFLLLCYCQHLALGFSMLPPPSDRWAVATAASASEKSLVVAGRAWRRGLRTAVLSDQPVNELMKAAANAHAESWLQTDDPNQQSTWEELWALAPFYAHRHFQANYDWMILAKADTLFFLEGAAGAVAGLDPALPHVVTDCFRFTYPKVADPGHPTMSAPRCLPCSFSIYVRTTVNVTDLQAFSQLVPGCPYCQTKTICQHSNNPGDLFGSNCESPTSVGFHAQPPWEYRMSGVAGIILSRGALEALPLAGMVDCMRASDPPWTKLEGDAALTHCFWVAGVGVTDPGVTAFHHGDLGLFSPDAGAQLKAVRRLYSFIKRECCDEMCLEQLEKQASLHVESHLHLSLESAAQSIANLGRLYQTYVRARVDTFHTKRNIYDWETRCS